jgi:hypothetical protein
MGMTLAQRAEATNAVVRRFRNKPFDWRKAATCIHLARAQAVALGHRPPPVKRFRSALGARRALEEMGFSTVTELLDAMFPGCRIPPAAMLVGDLGVLPGAEGLDAVVISAGAKVLGWHQDGGDRLAVIEVSRGDIAAAWRL